MSVEWFIGGFVAGAVARAVWPKLVAEREDPETLELMEGVRLARAGVEAAKYSQKWYLGHGISDTTGWREKQVRNAQRSLKNAEKALSQRLAELRAAKNAGEKSDHG